MKQINQDNQIICLLGSSGAGKDTLASYFKTQGYNFVTSHTTRPMRENEYEGNPYYFIDKEAMLELLNSNQLLEYRTYITLVDNIEDTWYYGIHKDEVDDSKKYVVVIDLKGFNELKAKLGNRVVGFYLEVPEPVRRERAMKRGSFDKVEWNRRVEADRNDFHWCKLKESNVTVIPFKYQTIEELYQEITEGIK